MPWERRWVPPGPPPGAPPWLPLAPVEGHWIDVYVETPAERQAAVRRGELAAQQERERAKRAEAASAQLANSASLADVRRAVAAHNPDLFAVAASLRAWKTAVASGEILATYDLVEWKARSREWEFYFRWLPDHVVRERRREPLWLIPGDQVWISSDGRKYRPVEDPQDREWPFRYSIVSGAGTVVLPRGTRFAPTRCNPSDHARPEYCLPTGEPVEATGTNPPYTRVNGNDLKRLLSD